MYYEATLNYDRRIWTPNISLVPRRLVENKLRIFLHLWQIKSCKDAHNTYNNNIRKNI